jgi:hypothetical protein
LLVALVVVLFWTLELPKAPPTPQVSPVAAMPAFYAHDGPCGSNVQLWAVWHNRGPPVGSQDTDIVI